MQHVEQSHNTLVVDRSRYFYQNTSKKICLNYRKRKDPKIVQNLLGPRIQNPSLPSAHIQLSRVQASSCSESKRPVVQSPSVQVQTSSRLESKGPESKRQLSRVQASMCPKSNRSDHASRVYLFQYVPTNRVYLEAVQSNLGLHPCTSSSSSFNKRINTK